MTAVSSRLGRFRLRAKRFGGPPEPWRRLVSETARSNRSHVGPALVGFVLFILLFITARSVDVPRTGYGIKSDEATYVAMALSAAYDFDLTYTRNDLERFAGLYHSGPNGIFLKRGKELRIRGRGSFPFIEVDKRTDRRNDRLYFGKAFIYSVLAAPFVRVYGLNGMLVFNVLLLAGVAICGYLFLSAHSPPTAAALFTTAFLFAAALPVYGVFLMPDIFNFALVFFAYFLWLYKEVRRDVRPKADATTDAVARATTPPESFVGSGFSRSFSQNWTDIAAAVVLGIATYSKPVPVAILVAPLVALAWWRRRWLHGFLVGATAVAVAAALFALNAAITGEFNYQGGDRKTFAEARFPFDRSDATWESFAGPVIDDPGEAAAEVLMNRELPVRFARNIKYFLLGRHFGFIPYYFPGVVAVVAWLFSRTQRDSWRVLTFAGFMAAAVGLLLLLPFTWSGGGGPPGNRYALSAYPVLFFITPPIASWVPGAIAWIGGALFTARMLVNPFVAAKFTWELYERGLPRRLPVELTMAGDLPVMLATEPLRGRIQYSHQNIYLYFLDQNAFAPEMPPEPYGMWISGSGTAEIIVRAEPFHAMSIEAESPIRTVLTISFGAEPVTTTLEPGRPVTFEVPVSGVKGRYGETVVLMRAHSSEGFVPHLDDPTSNDYRNLGALVRMRPVYDKT